MLEPIVPQRTEANATEAHTAAPGAVTFERLIAPTTPKRFFADHWGCSPLLLHRQDPDFYGTVFSIEDVDRYMTASRAARRRVSIVPPPGSGGSSRRAGLQDVSMDELYAAFSTGKTIRLESIQETWAPVAALIAGLEEVLEAELNVNLYLTPPQSQGLRSHFDTHDVFILQVQGSKQWRVWDVESPLPIETPTYLRHLADTSGDVVSENPETLLHHETLYQGDMLYMPRGFPHRALTTGEPSIHLAVAVKPQYWVDLLKTAVELACVDVEEIRRALPHGWSDDEAVREAMRERFRALIDLCVDKASFEPALRVLEQDRAARRRYPPDGHFAQLLRLDELAAGDWVERRAGLTCQVQGNARQASIRFASNEVRGPSAIRPAAEFIRRNRRFRVADLPGTLSDQSKVVLVRRLIREGLLRRVGGTDPR